MINVAKCDHIRIRHENLYGINVEQFIKLIEHKYKIDFRSLPQWKELVQRLHVSTTDCKRKIQDANYRKSLIINKLCMQFTRNSPFELTDKLARTYIKWQVIGRGKAPKIKIESIPDLNISAELEGTLDENIETPLTVHPNTEIVETEVISTEIPPLKSVGDSDSKVTETLSHLPVNISVNQHKYLSPLNSRDISFESKVSSLKMKSNPTIKSNIMFMNNTSLSSNPKEIFIEKKTLEEEIIKFSIINCTTEFMFIRYLHIINDMPFKKIKIIPPTPQKLYPGLAMKFKLIYQLRNCDELFTSALFFKISKKIASGSLAEGFEIPVVSKFNQQRKVAVNDSIHIPPAYLWQIRQDTGFPSAIVHVSVLDDYAYHLHITKRQIDITHEFQDSFVSMEVISDSTESFAERIGDEDVVAHSKMLTSQTEDVHEEIITTLDVIELIMEDILHLALNSFVFDHTYLYLKPKSDNSIRLYFTKPLSTGGGAAVPVRNGAWRVRSLDAASPVGHWVTGVPFPALFNGLYKRLLNSAYTRRKLSVGILLCLVGLTKSQQIIRVYLCYPLMS
ncbi:unnamed protein product [Diatraea saccharalis]|uniref:Uncharacterized protein n=1 Tax=Diatraea saccharalis TaxID=40085 RepID=A0A9N9RGA5_9NEOP|nr:unnamed protein product [Diatraea saccharalis]